jgi:ATP-dependent DNA helicase RecQ
VHEVLAEGDEFALDNYDASVRHDLRPLVLRTALTYLELLGALRKGTPFYAGYEFKPKVPLNEIELAFPGTPGEFVRRLISLAKRGRTWLSLDPDAAATELGTERKRVVRALEVLAERDLVELRSSDVRDRYARLVGPEEEDRLVTELVERFSHRERQEIERLAKVPALVEHEGCQTNALVGYFGEVRELPCGHCTFCLTGRSRRLPAPLSHPPLETVVPEDQLRELCAAHPAELGTSRRLARFLCGLSSPWFTKAKLSRHPLFGVADAYRFADVLEFANASD